MRAARTDTTQAAIVRALRQAGCSVLVLRASEVGVPDLAVGRNRLTYFLEVKSPGERPRQSQIAWHARWRGSPVAVVRTVEQALACVGVTR